MDFKVCFGIVLGMFCCVPILIFTINIIIRTNPVFLMSKQHQRLYKFLKTKNWKTNPNGWMDQYCIESDNLKITYDRFDNVYALRENDKLVCSYNPTKENPLTKIFNSVFVRPETPEQKKEKERIQQLENFLVKHNEKAV